MAIEHEQAHNEAMVRDKLAELLHDLLAHDGFGELHLRVRWLKRDLKEVLVTSGKEYRYVVSTARAGGS